MLVTERRLISFLPLALALLVAGTAGVSPIRAAEEPKQPNARAAALQAAWADLAGEDETKAARALLTLAASPKEAVEFLKANLRPVKADPKLIAKHVADLDSDDFATREQAQQELEYYGKYIKDDLKKVLAGAGPEAKRRISIVLDAMPSDGKAPAPQPKPKGGSVTIININGQRRILVDGVPIDETPKGPVGPPRPPRGWVRAARAVGVLEHLDTPEARQLLEKLAQGEAEALPTAGAKAALERLKTK